MKRTAMTRSTTPLTRTSFLTRTRIKSKGPNGYEREFQAAREFVLVRSTGLCEARFTQDCTGTAAHVHHRKLRAQGGTNDHANLLATCLPCHAAIHHFPGAAHSRGLIVLRHENPEKISVTHG